VDEFEVSVFGPSFGECICLHLGDGAWVVIDSCLDEARSNPASLTYLRSLRLDPGEAVRLIVITHWDDDHIRGIARVVEACAAADVACSAALGKTDIIQFVVEQETALGGSETGVDELRFVLRKVEERNRRIIWAKANTTLFPRPPGAAPNVVALSPSEDAFQRGVTAHIEAATGKKAAVPRRFRSPEGPNGASVATSVRNGDRWLLMGADLERSNNPHTGWAAVIAHAAPDEKASVVKVPHHGSADAHHDGMWSELAEEHPLSIVTPLSRGANDLPSPADIERLLAISGRLYQTATPVLERAKKDRDVERLLSRLHVPRVETLRGWGQVRARRSLLDPEAEWEVELSGDAVQL
jgi:hypothetical protein